ncbi:hypothetical protein ACQJBY_054210 [Aegilops geniculata]
MSFPNVSKWALLISLREKGSREAAGFAVKAGFTRTREEQECRSAVAAALRRGSRAGGSTVVPPMVAAAESPEQRSGGGREDEDADQIQMDRELGRRGEQERRDAGDGAAVELAAIKSISVDGLNPSIALKARGFGHLL